MRRLVKKSCVREAGAGEGVPVGGVERAVGVLDDNGVDREEDMGGLLNRKVMSKGRLAEPLNLADGEARRETMGTPIGHCDKGLL